MNTCGRSVSARVTNTYETMRTGNINAHFSHYKHRVVQKNVDHDAVCEHDSCKLLLNNGFVLVDVDARDRIWRR